MEFSNAERLIVLMLADLLANDPKRQSFDPAFIQEAILTGNSWAIDWEYPGAFAQEKPEQIVSETTDILDMWEFIEEASKHRFPGFDKSRESEHASVARFLTEKMDRFTRFKGRSDKGIMGLDGYRRMYKLFEPIRAKLADRASIALTEEEIEIIIAERVHPANRSSTASAK